MEFLTSTADILIGLSYSRDHESDADLVGLELLEKAKISPTGLLTFFEKNKDKIKSKIPQSWLSTHPLDIDRINTIKSKYQRTTAYEKILFQIADFKKYFTKK